MALLSRFFGLLLSPPAAEALPAGTDVSATPADTSPPGFAKRQIGLANCLTRQSNYDRALKVLNDTAENCDRDFVREKLYGVLGEWYGTIRGQDLGAPRECLNMVSSQSHPTSSQRSRLAEQVRSDVRSMIDRTFEDGEYEATHELCRTVSEYAGSTFRSEYAYGSAAEQVGARAAAMHPYSRLLDNWSEGQSPATWTKTATTPEENGRLESAQQNAESDEQWPTLYQLEHTETYPAGASAIGTLLGGAALAGEGSRDYSEVFDGLSVLTYYCIPITVFKVHRETLSGPITSAVPAPSTEGTNGNAPPPLHSVRGPVDARSGLAERRERRMDWGHPHRPRPNLTSLNVS